MSSRKTEVKDTLAYIRKWERIKTLADIGGLVIKVIILIVLVIYLIK